MKNQKSKLGNPVAVVAGYKVVEKGAESIPFLINTSFILLVGFFGIRAFMNRFKKKDEIAEFGPANITYGQAKSRADAIYGSISTFSNDFDTVSKNIAGLNYNGFIRVYNAFGQKKGTLLGGDLNLEEWCSNQFSSYQMQQLSFLLGGAFFQ